MIQVWFQCCVPALRMNLRKGNVPVQKQGDERLGNAGLALSLRLLRAPKTSTTTGLVCTVVGTPDRTARKLALFHERSCRQTSVYFHP